MTKVSVFPINDFIHHSKTLLSLKDIKYLVIFITDDLTKYLYDFKVVHLDFLDVFRDEEGFIENRHLRILNKIPFKKFNKIYVCCDGGISRSPAIASAIDKYLGNEEDYVIKISKYKYLNYDVHNEVLDILMKRLSKEKENENNK